MPEDGRPFSYPGWDVTDANQMWWKQVIDKTGGEFCYNDSWSGSKISGDPDTDKGCLLYRVKNKSIPEDTDICLVLSGVNDFRSAVDLGKFDPAKDPTKYNYKTFADSVCKTMELMGRNYPNTNFIWMTSFGDYTNGGAVAHTWNMYGVYYWEFDDIIVKAAQYYGFYCIDMRNYFSFLRYNEFGDGLYPKAAGMNRAARAVIHQLTNFYIKFS